MIEAKPRHRVRGKELLAVLGITGAAASAEAIVARRFCYGSRGATEEPGSSEATGALRPLVGHELNPPLQGIELALEVKGTEPLTITARTGTPGLPTIPGKTYRDRPPDTMPKSRNSITAEQDSSTVVSKSFTFATHPEHKESS